MESDRFDDLVRFMSGDASRRGVVRAGLGALALVASAALGLSAPDEGEARHRRQAKARKHAGKKHRKNSKGQHRHHGQTGPLTPPATCTPGSAGCPPDDPGETQDPDGPRSPEGAACQEDGECASGLCCLDSWDGLGLCAAAGSRRCDGNFDVCCGPGTECCETQCCPEGTHCCWAEDPFCAGP